ncbi:MAG: hypothetical protein Q7S03_00290 [bacterium]|nr:hypothetical protein [bacterium]
MKSNIIFTILSLVLAITAGLIFVTKADFLLPRSSNVNPAPMPTIPPVNPRTNPPITYNSAQTEKMLEIWKARPTLTPQDSLIRAKLINSLGGKSGVLSETAKYRLEYVKAPNDFEAEILTVDIETARLEALTWLKNKGLTADGICKLPLSFYLSRSVTQQLAGKNIDFNPLPGNCI